jgi:hypothetical protein
MSNDPRLFSCIYVEGKNYYHGIKVNHQVIRDFNKIITTKSLDSAKVLDNIKAKDIIYDAMDIEKDFIPNMCKIVIEIENEKYIFYISISKIEFMFAIPKKMNLQIESSNLTFKDE